MMMLIYFFVIIQNKIVHLINGAVKLILQVLLSNAYLIPKMVQLVEEIMYHFGNAKFVTGGEDGMLIAWDDFQLAAKEDYGPRRVNNKKLL